MFNWLLDIVSDDGQPDFKVTVWDNIKNLWEENPTKFFTNLLTIIGFITIIILPLVLLAKIGRKWYQKDNKQPQKNNEEDHS